MKKQCFKGLIILFLHLTAFQIHAQSTCQMEESAMLLKSNFSSIVSNDCAEDNDKCVGKIIWENGAYYEGEIQKGKLGEKGMLTVPTQFTYNGGFKNGLPHGNGKIIFENGGHYEGDWKEGKKEGFGSFYFSCGNEYLGQFKDDKLNGEGVLRINAKESFSGIWEDGLLNGEATQQLSDGSQFIGEFKSGVRHGTGTTTWKNGESMTAIWINGIIHEKSEFSFADSSKIIQFWDNGSLKNKATYIQPSGMKFSASPKNLANLIMSTSLSSSESIEHNFSLAWYSAALEYKTQDKFEDASEQLVFAQFFQDPFEDSELSNLVENELQFITEEKERTGMAKKETTKTNNN